VFSHRLASFGAAPDGATAFPQATILIGWLAELKRNGRVTKMRILVADDHELIREGISILMHNLSDNAEINEATTGDEAIAIASDSSEFDLAVIDLSLPGLSGLPMVAKLCELLPDTPVVILSACEDRYQVLKAIECGASGFVYKSLGKTVLEEALLMVLAGGVFMPPLTDSTDIPHITARQRQVLELLVEGKSNKEIANRLHISTNTIKNHLAKLYDQLSVSNRTQAVMKARKLVSTSSF